MSEAPLNQGDLKMRTRTVLGSYTSSKPSQTVLRGGARAPTVVKERDDLGEKGFEQGERGGAGRV